MTSLPPASRNPFAAAARAFANLGCNLRAGLRAAFFLPVPVRGLRVSALQVAVLVALLPLPPFLDQFAQLGADGRFTSDGVPAALVIFPVGFVIAALMATLSRRRDLLLPLLIVYLATALVTDSIYLVVPYLSARAEAFYDRYNDTVGRVPIYWFAVVVATAWARLLAMTRAQLRAVAFASALLIVIPLDAVWWGRTLWTEPPAADTASAAQLQRYNAPLQEDVLYRQPQLLQEALQRIEPAHGAAPAMYFLGFAPDAEQNVFMREMDSVVKIFDRRFATPAHTLALISNARTLHTVPMATRTGLGLALRRFGAVMRDDDVLFLYLTSHGSRDHRLAVEFGPLQLDDLTPAALKDMLDAAGIKWRVIVISACYSGGFIDTLRSDDTLVITAAARDRTSFGCSDEETFTYFGKAYFDEALRHTDSFIDAFYLARKSVTAKEKAEGFQPSDPQISVGRNIETKLRNFEKRLSSSD